MPESTVALVAFAVLDEEEEEEEEEDVDVDDDMATNSPKEEAHDVWGTITP
jgi:hypothetical protein